MRSANDFFVRTDFWRRNMRRFDTKFGNEKIFTFSRKYFFVRKNCLMSTISLLSSQLECIFDVNLVNFVVKICMYTKNSLYTHQFTCIMHVIFVPACIYACSFVHQNTWILTILWIFMCFLHFSYVNNTFRVLSTLLPSIIPTFAFIKVKKTIFWPPEMSFFRPYFEHPNYDPQNRDFDPQISILTPKSRIIEKKWKKVKKSEKKSLFSIIYRFLTVFFTFFHFFAILRWNASSRASVST